jgi:hypothetical protein
MIYETDTDLTYVWGGSAWQQVSGGTAVGNSGLVYITSVSLAGASAASPLNITSCFSSTYTNYRIVVSGFVNTSAAFLQFQMLSGTTPANAAGSYKIQRLLASGVTVTATSGSDTKGNLPPGDTTGSASSSDIYNPNQAVFTNFVGVGNYNGNTGAPLIDLDSTSHNVATAYDGIRLFPEGGTVTTATVTIFGYRKA